MHEGTITRHIVESVLEEATSRKAKKVVEVNLVIGSLTFLNPEQVKFWYGILTKDTILEGSRLLVEEEKGKVHCEECKYEGDFKYVDDPALHVLSPTLHCPRCDGTVKIAGGKDCVIRNIKMLI